MSLVLLGILNSQASAAGGGAAYDLLETQVLTSSASSVTFTGLGSYSDYKHLQIRAVARDTRATTQSSGRITINSDTGANYAFHNLKGDGSSVTSSGLGSFNYLPTVTIPAANFTANAFGAFVLDLLDFSSTSKNKTLRALGGRAGSSNQIQLDSGLWVSTSAVTALTIAAFTGYAIGSRFSLYGVK